MNRLCLWMGVPLLFLTQPALSTPYFARTYGLTCRTCHSGFPRLNAFGLAFKANNFRIPDAEKEAPLAWQKTIPLAVQVKPTLQRTHPGAGKVQFTDTQLLAGGLLTRSTAFYLHHSYFVDATPVTFPSYEFWAQQVLDQRGKIMLKIGQFELPYAYSPETTRTTVFSPLLFGVGLQGNDVRLGSAMSGLQMSGVTPSGTSWQIAGGAPSPLAAGNLIGERQFFGRFRDVFVRVAQGGPSQQAGLFAYWTHPPRSRTDPNSEERGHRFGIEGVLFWRGFQVHGMAVYGENSDPSGTGRKGFFRSAFLEADYMIRPWIGLTGRWDTQTVDTGVVHGYADAKTISLRLYPYEKIKLVAEYQRRAHGQSATAFLASVSF